jgi:phosphopantothenoylcysteine decarboxylase/phosphopantothenate--cysteine ligase
MNIILGITGGIAAYKTPTFASILTRQGHNVRCIVTPDALNFVTEMSLAVMSKNPVVKSLSNEVDGVVRHIEMANWCDRFVVVPATANTVAKLATGMADNALAATVLALPDDNVKVKKILFPAMNSNMYHSKSVNRNLSLLRDDCWYICDPETGELACGDVGDGKLPSTKKVIDYILSEKNHYDRQSL